MPTTTQAVRDHDPPDSPKDSAHSPCSCAGSPGSPPSWPSPSAGPSRTIFPGQPDRPGAAHPDPGLVLAPSLRHARLAGLGLLRLLRHHSLVAHVRGRRSKPATPRLGRHSAAAAVSAVMSAVIVLGQFRAHSGRAGRRRPDLRLSQPSCSSWPTPAAAERTTRHGDATRWWPATPCGASPSPITATATSGRPSTRPTPAYLSRVAATLTDAHWIYPGWSLVIPDAADPDVARLRAAGERRIRPPPHRITAMPAQSTRSINQPERCRAASVTTPYQRSQNRRQPVPVHAPQRPGHPHTETPTTAAGRAWLTVTRHPGAASHAVHRYPQAPRGSQRASAMTSAPLAIGAGIFGLAAIGLVGALDRRRRRQSGRRTPGTRIPLPAPHSPLADLELPAPPLRPSRQPVLAHPPRRPTGPRRRPRRRTAARGARRPRPPPRSRRPRQPGTGDPPAPFESQPGEPSIWHLPCHRRPGCPRRHRR